MKLPKTFLAVNLSDAFSFQEKQNQNDNEGLEMKLSSGKKGAEVDAIGLGAQQEEAGSGDVAHEPEGITGEGSPAAAASAADPRTVLTAADASVDATMAGDLVPTQETQPEGAREAGQSVAGGEADEKI